MADYFLLHDTAAFEGQLRPALAEARRQRSFAPCRALCAALVGPARDYAQRYHLGDVEPLLAAVAQGQLPFDRTLWRALVGEVLLFGAAEVPELTANADTLCCLLAPEHYRRGVTQREQLAPIQQALRGSRDLTFGAAVYRPDHAGYNDAADMGRLAAYLQGVDPARWTAADLEPLPDLDAADRAEEVSFAREWFPALVELYARAQQRGQVVVLEEIW
jgi:hypothetical protein